MKKSMLTAFAALFAMGTFGWTGVGSAEARSYHRHSGFSHHSYHRHSYGFRHHSSRRGETCWRTNRHTGAHFRIC